MHKPPVEEYVNDMATMIDHIFSYEFKTHNLKKPTNLEVPKLKIAVDQYSGQSPRKS